MVSISAISVSSVYVFIMYVPVRHTQNSQSFGGLKATSVRRHKLVKWIFSDKDVDMQWV
jgi:hypothetical protein